MDTAEIVVSGDDSTAPAHHASLGARPETDLEIQYALVSGHYDLSADVNAVFHHTITIGMNTISMNTIGRLGRDLTLEVPTGIIHGHRSGVICKAMASPAFAAAAAGQCIDRCVDKRLEAWCADHDGCNQDLARSPSQCNSEGFDVLE
ncbi:hypothetical protein FOXYS1_2780 [Fusarium oxysporum]|uniref:Uncharacterized protein n=1 Tax=Fusarium oxysporum TaxID=5507 RepID=A0A8H5AJT8_FUSOX|nr:hypothetical protein FOXYS1_2780 [Fusarium oxysporum]